MHLRKLLILSALFFSVLSGYPGKLVIIGGGSELSSPDAWNQAPYAWAIEQSGNKRIALVSYNEESDWLPNYFMNSCGASAAKNFRISSPATADSQETYDSLMAYDVIFLKGGDQYNYYRVYKNTLTHQAIQDKFDEGGVICGTSAGLAVMSEVIFTAKNGTVYPDECLEDPNNYYVDLSDDFLQLFPGYIFDSHFTDRGRFARLCGFLAHWKFERNEMIAGIGVDEQTALTIDEARVGTVYGTGCANIYIPYGDETYHQNDSRLIVDSIRVIQLLHGCTFDFSTLEVSGLHDFIQPSKLQETGNYTVLMSGGETLPQNVPLLENLYAQQGNPDDAILILTGSSTGPAETFRDFLEELGAPTVYLYSAIPENGSDAGLAGAINYSPKILLINNHYEVFYEFASATENGGLLGKRLKQDGMVSAFCGDNSRFAGKTVINNYLQPNASYNGKLAFDPGLGILETSVVMPRTYDNSDMYENAAAGIPFALVKDSCAYGIWLTKENFAVYAPEEGKTFLTSFGDLPMMILQNRGGFTGIAGQTPSGAGLNYRQIAGFNHAKLSILDTPFKFQTGNHITYDIAEAGNLSALSPVVYPNPANRQVTLEWPGNGAKVSIISASGQICMSFPRFQDRLVFTTYHLPEGLYFIRLISEDDERQFSLKINIKH